MLVIAPMVLMPYGITAFRLCSYIFLKPSGFHKLVEFRWNCAPRCGKISDVRIHITAV